MIRLLVLNQFASTPEYSSGSGERYYYLSKYFSSEGLYSTIISAGFNHLFLKKPKTETLFSHEPISGGQFIWVKVKKYDANSTFGRVFNLFEFAAKLFLLKRHIVKNTDIVVVSSMSIFPVVYALFLKLRYGIPFILEIRDIWPLSPIEIGGYSPNHPYMKLIKLVARIGYKKSVHIISVLPNFQDYLEDIERLKKHVTWIPNGIELTGEFRNKISEINSSFKVIYTGALGDANSLEYLIDAAKMFNTEDRVEFIIVGNGPRKLDLMQRAEGVDHIKFLEKIPKNEVVKLIATADCCYHGCRNLNLYRYGISPNKMNDYMLAAKPIISSSPCITDPVVIARAGFQVAAEDPNEIYCAIIRMKEMSEHDRSELGLNGYNYLKENNSYQEISNRYRKVIDYSIRLARG